MDKKGQWARAIARERRSQERRERIQETIELLKEGYSAPKIAVELGVSTNTANHYIKEAKHLEEFNKKEKERWIVREKERARIEAEREKAREKRVKRIKKNLTEVVFILPALSLAILIFISGFSWIFFIFIAMSELNLTGALIIIFLISILFVPIILFLLWLWKKVNKWAYGNKRLSRL